MESLVNNQIERDTSHLVAFLEDDILVYFSKIFFGMNAFRMFNLLNYTNHAKPLRMVSAQFTIYTVPGQNVSRQNISVLESRERVGGQVDVLTLVF